MLFYETTFKRFKNPNMPDVNVRPIVMYGLRFWTTLIVTNELRLKRLFKKRILWTTPRPIINGVVKEK